MERETMLKNVEPPEIEMDTVPAGEFVMGLAGNWPQKGREEPSHTVSLEDYQIGRFEVTNAQYRRFVEDTGHPWNDGPDDLPASGLTWQDAWLFCAWLRLVTGKPYHLPTEAQWEKAATWNPQKGRKQPYPWGNKRDDKRCNLLTKHPGGPTPVGSFSPKGDSPYGCADMIGNVEEWCNSSLAPYPYDATDGREELHLHGRRVIRGGDWYSFAPVSGIMQNAPSDWWVWLWGLRVALSPALVKAHDVFTRRAFQDIEQALRERRAIVGSPSANAQNGYDLGSYLLKLREMGLDRFTEAEAAFDQAIRLIETGGGSPQSQMDSPVFWAYYNRAVTRDERGLVLEALLDIDRAAELAPDDGDTLYLRASIMGRVGHWAEAERELQKAISKASVHPAQKVTEAEIHAGLHRLEEAIKVLTELIQSPLFGPLSRPQLHLQRARAYELLGDTQRQMSDFCHYVLWRPQAPESAALQQKIEAYRRQEGS